MSPLMSRTRAWSIALLAAMIYAAAQTGAISLAVKNVPLLEVYLFELPVWIGVISMGPVVFWLARRLPLFGKHALRNFFAHLVPAILVVFLMFVLVESIRRYLVSPLVIQRGIASTKESLNYARPTDGLNIFMAALLAFRYYVVFFLFVYFAQALFHYSVTYYRERNAAQIRSQELQTLLAQSQLDALRLQLQPHFLFNTLNTVSGLMTKDVGLARRMLARLSDLLRTTLHEPDVHEVTLASELEFLDCFLEIQTARFGQRLRVEKTIDPHTRDLLVPRMLLQPLVENSIRHGMRDGDDRPLCVRVEASGSGASLRLSVIDDGLGLAGDRLEEGLGLGNTRRRLEQLYGDGQQMQFSTPTGGGFEVALVIPARATPEATSHEHAVRETA
jgi:two-component system LytT family sensor kinase